MPDKILLVDDEENVLRGYYRTLQRNFAIEIALGGESALQAMEEHGPFAVMVSDMRMPGMNGLELLTIVKRRWPETIRIMLTGNADQSTAVEAVNQGEVFRFLTKPCATERLNAMIEAGLRQFHLVQAEKTLLEKTLLGSVRVLTELLDLRDPHTFGRAQAIRDRSLLLARSLDFEDDWTLEVACMLAPIGYVVLPQELMAKLGTGKVLTAAERAMADRVPELGARLVENIPRLGPVGRIIRYQNKGFDGSGFPLDEVRGEQIPLGARILKAVSDFTDRLDTRKDAHVITESMKLHGEVYDPAVLEELEKHLVALTPSQGSAPERVVTVAELCEGMVLSQDVRHHSGQLVLSAGLRLGGPYLEILKTLGELMGIQEPIHVRGH